MAAVTEYPTKEELAQFYDSLHAAKVEGAVTGTVPAMEVSRKMVEHFLRGKMAGFERVYYFVYDGVKVFEAGKREEGERIERLTQDQVLHGDKS